MPFIDDLGDLAIDWIGGQIRQPGVGGTQLPMFPLSDVPATTGGTTTVIPGTGGPMMPAAVCNGPSPVYKKVAGQYRWVYPKRRRRRQLLTQSDAAGLAKLKGIVGQGKVMEVWIATHSR